jgi:hypothetical protein
MRRIPLFLSNKKVKMVIELTPNKGFFSKYFTLSLTLPPEGEVWGGGDHPFGAN